MKNPNNFILLVLAIGLFFTFTSPQYTQVKALQATAAEYSSAIANVSRLTETRDALLVKAQAITPEERERLEKVLPDNVDAVRLAFDLDTIAARYGISVTDLSVDARPDPGAGLAVLPGYEPPYEKAIVTFHFLSNYENFLKFLSDIERTVRIMDVKSVSFQAVDAGLYRHEMKVETYWLK